MRAHPLRLGLLVLGLLWKDCFAAHNDAAIQVPLVASKTGPYYVNIQGDLNIKSFNALDDLSLLSYTGYTTLKHTSFPRHSVRIKKSKFCDGTVE